MFYSYFHWWARNTFSVYVYDISRSYYERPRLILLIHYNFYKHAVTNHCGFGWVSEEHDKITNFSGTVLMTYNMTSV